MTKQILACLAVNSLLWLLALVWAILSGRRAATPWIFCSLMASCALLNSFYVWAHWGFRPENLFSEGARRFADDPLVFLVLLLLRRGRVKRR